jgi:hypothetical protein
MDPGILHPPAFDIPTDATLPETPAQCFEPRLPHRRGVCPQRTKHTVVNVQVSAFAAYDSVKAIIPQTNGQGSIALILSLEKGAIAGYAFCEQEIRKQRRDG